MWIKRLNINEFPFGIDNGTNMDLSPGVVVIGGPNEAGKTTFMRILRNLGYGFSESDFPYSDSNLDIESVLTESDIDYHLQLRDLDKPFLQTGSSSNDLDLQVHDLFGGVGAYEFKQLFTISLDELKNRPDDESDTVAEDELATVLLGAGWSDISRIPEIRERIRQRYGEDGDRSGRTVTQFMDRIERTLEQRQQAKENVKKYYRQKRLLGDIEEKLTDREEALTDEQKDLHRLQVICNHYDQIETYRSLKGTLESEQNQAILHYYPENGKVQGERKKERLETTREEMEEKRQEIRTLSGIEQVDDYLEQLLDYSEEVEQFASDSNVYVEQCRSITDTEEQLEVRENRLQNRLEDLYPSDEVQLEELQNLISDHDTEEELEQLLASYKELQESIDQQENEKKDLQQTRDDLTSKLEKIPDTSYRMRMLFGGISSLTLIAGSMSFPYFSTFEGAWYVGGAGATVGVLWLIYYFVYRVSEAVEHKNNRSQTQEELEQVEEQLEDVEEAIQSTRKNVESREEKIQELRNQLGVPELRDSYEIPDVHRQALQLKEDYHDLLEEQDQLRQKKRRVWKKLTTAENLVHRLSEQTVSAGRSVESESTHKGKGDRASLAGDTEERVSQEIPATFGPEYIEQAERISDTLEHFEDQLEVARNLQQLEKKQNKQKEEIRQSIREVNDQLNGSINGGQEGSLHDELQSFIDMGDTYRDLEDKKTKLERIKNELTRLLNLDNNLQHFTRDDQDTNEENALDALISAASSYDSIEAVERRIQQMESSIQEIKEEIHEIREHRDQIKKRMVELRNDREFVELSRRIQRARNELKPLARDLVVHRLAELLLEELYRRYIDKACGSILKRASQYFQKITGEKYERIDPSMELSESLYKAREDAAVEKYPGVLSRGTREQLFLSVRLARITDIDPALPVILDDSAANFDPARRQWVSQLINQISDTHQTFVLTCHPEMIKILSHNVENIQYWALDDGSFDGPHNKPDHLIDVLKQDMT